MASYISKTESLESEESVYIRGKESSTDQAQVLEISGTFNARIYLEVSNDGEEFTEIFQYPTPSLSGRWSTKDIQSVVVADSRRIRIDNRSKNNGEVNIMGVEV